MSSQPPFRRSPDPAPDNNPRPDPPPGRRVRVVLHRTADTGLMYIARAIADLTRFGDAEARQRMWEVYHRGKALVLVTHFERAELYVEQFAERGLFASLEPA